VIQASPFLRYALLADALAGGPVGLLLALVAGPLENLLGLPQSLLQYAGVFLVIFATVIFLLWTQEQPSRASVWIVIALNALWVVGSIGLLFVGSIAPSGLGYVIFQAGLVAVFIGTQYTGLQRSVAVKP
jgi:hypothetical protein